MMNNRFYFLLENFAPLITYIMNLSNHHEYFKDFNKTKNTIDLLINEAKEKIYTTDPNLFEDSIFPMVAFIDEKILLSHWKYKKSWLNNRLQKKYFQSLDLGKEFFDRFEVLNTIDIRLFYIYIVNLGFQGKYYNKNHYELKTFIHINNNYFNEHITKEIEEQFIQNQKTKIKKKSLIKKRVFFVCILALILITVYHNVNQNLEQQMYHSTNKKEKEINYEFK